MSRCTGSIQAVRLRVCRLLADGTPDAGADNLYVTDALIKVDWKLVLKAGTSYELANGSDNLCINYQARDRIKSVDLTMELCVLDAELIELLTGAHIITIGGEHRGWSLPDPDEDLDNEVSIEVWSLAMDGDEQAVIGSDLAYHRWVWPRTTWVFGDGSLANEPLRVPVSGRGRSNSNFGDGPGNDFPWGAISGPMGEFLDDSVPDATCGYQTLVGS